ncbi:hypothetical protein [Vibrio sp. D431a]|uniref:hypothetical protein n=1 Tax=Vibrio sp. D431a TaxID=2837388 RepID=UPI00255646C1|nr:hypothetical protein [Vibrio sp. D431a]MDK9793784.1 hypothetical protein [Vibrio sp. D431a]
MNHYAKPHNKSIAETSNKNLNARLYEVRIPTSASGKALKNFLHNHPECTYKGKSRSGKPSFMIPKTMDIRITSNGNVFVGDKVVYEKYR